MSDYSIAVGAEFISAYKAFCDESGCLDRIGNELVASDGIHLTRAGSKFLIAQIAPVLLDFTGCDDTTLPALRRRMSRRLPPGRRRC